jgi:putative flippase GtrA
MTGRIERLYRRHREVVVFAAAGLVNTGVDFAAFSLLLALMPGLKTEYAQAAGYCCGLVCGFFLNKYVTFRSNAAWGWQAVRFALCNLFTLGVSVGCIRLFHGVLGIQEHIAKLFLVTPVTMVLNFLLYKFVVFGKNRHSKSR